MLLGCFYSSMADAAVQVLPAVCAGGGDGEVQKGGPARELQLMAATTPSNSLPTSLPLYLYFAFFRSWAWMMATP